MKSTCVTPGCERSVHSRGLCPPHYQEARRAGVLEPRDSEWHRLSEVNAETKTGVCSICGPTRVRIRKTRANECYAKREIDYARPSRISPAARRRRLLKSQYQLTPEEHDEMLRYQGGGCAICGAEKSTDGRSLAVDHCHATGRVRGLLCGRCNRALGGFADDTDRLRRAIRYLAAQPQ